MKELCPILFLALLAVCDAAPDANLASRFAEFQKVAQTKRSKEIFELGRKLLPDIEAKGTPIQASDVALAVAFAADRIGIPDDAITAAQDAVRIVSMSRQGNMRAWDFMLLAHMSGIQVKHLYNAGRLTTARSLQRDAFQHLGDAVKMETGTAWRPGQPIPRTISQTTLDMLLRTVRYEIPLLGAEGRNVEAVEAARKLEASLRSDGGFYHSPLLTEIASELRFLGYWRDCRQTLDRIIGMTPHDSPSNLVARFNLAYWRSQVEGPDPALLAEAKELSIKLEKIDGKAETNSLRRLMAKMAFAYREAGFDIGDLEKLIKEAQAAGTTMEAIYARRDMAVIQRKSQNFAEAEKNLLGTLADLRSIGKKSGEPTVYREYGALLTESGRPREAIRMISEALRLTKLFKWTQHLPRVYHSLAQAQIEAGDAIGLRATLTELEKLLAADGLEPDRRLDAKVAIALCLKSLGDASRAAAMLRGAVKDGGADGLTKWETDWAEKFPLNEIKLVSAAPAPVDAAAQSDLQPRVVTSAVLPTEPARVRFTLSNPSAKSIRGTVVLDGAPLQATWDAQTDTGRVTCLASGGEKQASHEITLEAGGEYQIIGDAGGEVSAQLKVHWRPVSGALQESNWHLTRSEPDGLDIAVTNASLAGRNPFYALRLHHAISRRDGKSDEAVNFRVKSSQPMRLEITDPNSGDLLAADSNGDGDFEDAGDLLASDRDRDGFPDLSCERGELAEFGLLVFPVKERQEKGDVTLEVQLKDPTGWQAAAQDVLKN